jgi:hypothetical protein
MRVWEWFSTTIETAYFQRWQRVHCVAEYRPQLFGAFLLPDKLRQIFRIHGRQIEFKTGFLDQFGRLPIRSKFALLGNPLDGLSQIFTFRLYGGHGNHPLQKLSYYFLPRRTRRTRRTRSIYKTIRLMPAFIYLTLKFISRPIRMPDNFMYVNS